MAGNGTFCASHGKIRTGRRSLLNIQLLLVYASWPKSDGISHELANDRLCADICRLQPQVDDPPFAHESPRRGRLLRTPSATPIPKLKAPFPQARKISEPSNTLPSSRVSRNPSPKRSGVDGQQSSSSPILTRLLELYPQQMRLSLLRQRPQPLDIAV